MALYIKKIRIREWRYVFSMCKNCRGSGVLMKLEKFGNKLIQFEVHLFGGLDPTGSKDYWWSSTKISLITIYCIKNLSWLVRSVVLLLLVLLVSHLFATFLCKLMTNYLFWVILSFYCIPANYNNYLKYFY